MLSLSLVIGVAGLILYIVSSDKTRRQLREDIGRIVFAAAALAVFIVWATKTVYP